VNEQSPEFVEIFLQEASERLQFLREYAGILQDPYPQAQDVERLYIAAHTLGGTSASYGFPLFSEIAGKLAHIFQYAMNATIAQDAAGPLVEFVSEGIAVLETDLLMISANQVEAAEDIDAFKQKYPFAFQAAPQPQAQPEKVLEDEPQMPQGQDAGPDMPPLPDDGEVPPEILEFFVPEAEEHLQVVTDCLLSLETNPNPDEIHRLLRAMHTVKGSAAQVGLQRIAHVAHRAEDLIGRVRDGALRPSAEIVDLCLEAVDVLKRILYRQWPDESTLQSAVRALFLRIAKLVPEESQAEASSQPVQAQPSIPASPGPTIVAPQPERGVPSQRPEAMAEASFPAAEENPVPSAAPRVVREEDTRRSPALAAGEALSDEAAEMDAATGLRPTAPVAAPVFAQSSAKPLEKAEPAKDGEAKKEPSSTPQSKSVRIALERLDRMMNAVGELVINRTRMLGRVAELERLADVLNFSKARMQDKVAEFQEKYEYSRIVQPAPRTSSSEMFPLRGGYSSYSHSFDHALAEFSELEMDRYDDFNILSRSLTEISADITEVLTQLDGFVRRVDSDIDEFTKLAHRLQDEITQARMVPIGNLYTRLSRTVRDAAKAVNKRVELTLAGAETELDNNIIQQISDPLIHLVRNAVAHGIEREDERYGCGKSDQGSIAVRAYHRGNHIYIEVEDDGRGIDYDRVRKTAVENGLLSAESAAELAERQLLELLFEPGFTTAPRKTELAGRGVGLDVVKANLAQLNGEIEIETEKGRGSRFTLKVPLTLIISQALFVRCGDHTFALPLAFIEEIRRLRVNEIEEVGRRLMTKVRDSVTEVVRLDSALGLEHVEPVNGFFRMVIVNVAGRQVGLVVEEVIRKDEIVIKSLGEYLRNLKMFPGATIAPDGSLILLIDVNRLIAGEAIERRPLMTSANAARVFAPGAEAVARGSIPQEAIDVVRKEKVVVLVDDSISVRKFVGRMLEKAGYRVKLAADGLEALEIVTQTRCDLVVTDLEMPRTNGYELLNHLRQDAETRSLPVMVVTSRAGAKHRERAMKDGAAAFMTKPVQEDQFITAVTNLIGPAADRVESAGDRLQGVGDR
jgi:chemotaxis protein histidine kinase CheA/ActR/RegA family two-component response regulator